MRQPVLHIDKNRNKTIDKAFGSLYNYICVLVIRHRRMNSKPHIGRGIQAWRNTQVAEEAPLLRV